MKKASLFTLLFFVGFIVFFCIRLGYGYLSYPSGSTIQNNQNSGYYNFNFSSGVRNIAKEKYAKSARHRTTTAQTAFDQKYEKVANLGLSTRHYEADEAKLRNTIKTYEALTQYEQLQGLAGKRLLLLSIGVNPDKFELIIDDLRNIGTITSLNISKTDKTNEYKNLKATQISLEKSRKALEALKQREASVKELISLEERILTLEQQIQDLGVNLGDFDSEYEFVTVKMVLQEKEDLLQIAFSRRAFVAFGWTIKYYSMFVISFLLTIIAGYVALGALSLAIRLIRTLSDK